MKKNAVGKGWAWQCDFGLCHWAAPTREKLLRDGKPTPEAKAISVRIVPTKQYRKLQPNA